MSDDTEITWRHVVQPCPCCGQPRVVREYLTYPKVTITPRSEDEHKAAQTPADWDQQP